MQKKFFSWSLFLKALNHKGLSQNAFARKANFNPGTVNKLKKVKNVHKKEIIEAIERILGVKYEDLCTESPGNITNVVPETLPQFQRWPIVGETAAGPWISAVESTEYAGFADEYMNVLADIHDPNGYALKVAGDSMSPVIPEGSIIAVSPNSEVKNGDIAVIFVKSEISAYQCEVCVKLFHWRGAESQEAVLTSYNPEYKEIILPRSSIVKLHKVVQYTVHLR